MNNTIPRTIICGALLLLTACAVTQGYIEETRTDKSIQVAFDRSKYDMYRVYSEALRMNLDLHGKTVFRVTVSAEGKVVKSAVVESTLNDSKVSAALNKIIYGMNFGKVRQFGDVTFNYPIDFILK